MKHFVIGGAGFIGSNMVDALLESPDSEVVVFDNFVSGKLSYVEHHLKDRRFKLIEGDLLDLPRLESAIAGSDFVFHFAANADIVRSIIETDRDLRLGVIATYNVIEAMKLS
jgi:UDP-glucose 4-epimerase